MLRDEQGPVASLRFCWLLAQVFPYLAGGQCYFYSIVVYSYVFFFFFDLLVLTSFPLNSLFLCLWLQMFLH